jgi:putative exosortase-associated protein (TIGR04073 family)
MKRYGVIILLMFFSLQPLGLSYEQSGDYMMDSFTKLGKGITNILASPFEIPSVWAHEIKEKEAVGVFYGLPKGVLFFGRRLLFGVTEVATFLIPSHETLPNIETTLESPLFIEE